MLSFVLERSEDWLKFDDLYSFNPKRKIPTYKFGSIDWLKIIRDLGLLLSTTEVRVMYDDTTKVIMILQFANSCESCGKQETYLFRENGFIMGKCLYCREVQLVKPE